MQQREHVPYAPISGLPWGDGGDDDNGDIDSDDDDGDNDSDDDSDDDDGGDDDSDDDSDDDDGSRTTFNDPSLRETLCTIGHLLVTLGPTTGLCLITPLLGKLCAPLGIFW